MNRPSYLLILTFLFSAVFFLNNNTLAADLQVLREQCDSCHGPDGHSERADVPAIAGKSISYMKEAMAQFYFFERHCPDKRPRTQKGTGSSTNMCSIASTLSDEEVLTLSQFYNSK